jgi:hypothetical protein
MNVKKINMIYAPILIPTLCRFSHFKRLIESLQKNSYAKYSDLYIALDYPAHDIHWEGYNKICEYLPFITGFNRVEVLKRPYNYGAGKNIEDARSLIFNTYDRVIVSEDDNVMSPNFLEFMDKGLDLFENDDAVFAINGYRHFYNIKFQGNTFFLQGVDFSAWGYGFWNKKFRKSQMNISRSYFIRGLLYPASFYRIARCGCQKVLSLFSLILSKGKIPMSDFTYSLYLMIEKKNVVMPTVSKVRNEGWDGSGINCDDENKLLSEIHNNQELDNSVSFNYIGDGHSFYSENRKIYVKENYAFVKWRLFPLRLVRILYDCMLGKR